MRMRTKGAKIAVPEGDACFVFVLPMPSELDELNDRHTTHVDKDGEDVTDTDNRAVIKDLWCNYLTSWNGVEDGDGAPINCGIETRVATWMADPSVCIGIVTRAFEMAKNREDLAEKN